MKKLTIQEYAFKNGISERTVRRYIDAGKVPALKEIIDNRETTMVIIDEDNEQENIIDGQVVSQFDRQIEQNNSSQKALSDNNDFISLIKDMQQQLVSYAELAGQTKLLTASEDRTKQEYFQVVQENATLKAELKQIQEKLKNYEEKQNKLTDWFKRL